MQGKEASFRVTSSNKILLQRSPEFPYNRSSQQNIWLEGRAKQVVLICLPKHTHCFYLHFMNSLILLIGNKVDNKIY